MNNEYVEGALPATLATVAASKREPVLRPGLRELPTSTLFIVDLTTQSEEEATPQFWRMLVRTVSGVLELINAADTTHSNVTVLPGRAAYEVEPIAESMTRVDFFSPDIVTYSLSSGRQFVVVNDGEPCQMKTCFEATGR